MRPELDNVLSIDGHSDFSLSGDILTFYDRDDRRIKLVREGIERDVADICARLISYIASVPKRVLLIVSMFPNVDELSVHGGKTHHSCRSNVDGIMESVDSEWLPFFILSKRCIYLGEWQRILLLRIEDKISAKRFSLMDFQRPT